MVADRLHLARIAPVAILAACLALPAPAAAKRSAGGLSSRLARLAKPAVRSAPRAVQARRLSLAEEGPGSLLRRGNRVLAYVHFGRGALAALSRVRSAGAQVVDASRSYQTVTVAVKPGQLRQLARVRGVAGIVAALAPVTRAATCPSGEIVSEGDEQLNARAAREDSLAGEPDGSGVTVGILSDSFDQATEAADESGSIATHAEEDEQSGDLPGECETTPVGIRSELNEAFVSEASDEGRAMAQIVHDLAPGAPIEFASAFNGEEAFAQSIEELAEPVGQGGAEAGVIADDVFYLEEPFFQDGPVAVAVGKAVAEGATYFSAAGNDNLIDAEGRDIASWETPEYRDAGSCPAAVEAKVGFKAFHCLDFNPGAAVDRTFGIKVEPGATLTADLQWDEPRFGVTTDLDAFLLNATGSVLAESHEDNVNETGMPFESFAWTNESGSTRTVQLVVNRFAGGSPRVKFGLIENGSGVSATEYPRSTGEDVVGPAIFGHSAAADAISVGAVPFVTKSTPEAYSSRGPVYRDLGPVEGITPATPIPPETLSKPDLAATDCGRTTFFASFGKILKAEPAEAWHFCGTSAAAPHAAAVAALMLEAEPAASPAAVRAALYESADPVGAFGACAVGKGLIEAVGAVEAAVNHTGAAGPSCEPPEPGDPEEAAAPGDWGRETPPEPPTSTPAASTPAPPVTPQRKVAPRTFFKKRPRKVVHTRHHRAKVVFRFGSNVIGVSYACRVDGGLFRICPRRFVRRFPLGRHVLRVSARDAEGYGDRTPAVYRFRVKSRRR